MTMKKSDELNFLCLRNLGDTYLQKKCIDDYFGSTDLKFRVFCRPGNEQLFSNSNYEVITLDVYPTLRFFLNIRKWFEVTQILRQYHGVFISFFGDWFDLIVLLSSNVKFIFPVWGRAFFLRRLIRIPLFKLPFGKGFCIRNDNLYEAFDEYTLKILGDFKIEKKIFASSKELKFNIDHTIQVKSHVAFAPFGSSKTKMLSFETILAIFDSCTRLNFDLIILSTEAQKRDLIEVAGDREVTYCCDISDGFEHVKRAKYYIGVDTFWSHIAVNFHIPTLVFSGVIPAKFIYPDYVEELSFGNQCRLYPCFNLSRCENLKDPYICLGHNVDKDLLRSDLSRFLNS